MSIGKLLAGVEHAGQFGVWLGGLDGRAAFSHRADHPHDAASTMKLPVAIALARLVDDGALALDQPVTVHNDFASAKPDTRFAVRREEDDARDAWDHLGGEVTVDWLVTEMITRSGNLVTNLVLELTGLRAADQVLREFGSGPSAVRRGIDDLQANTVGIRNEMTPADLAAVLIAVAQDRAAGAESSAYLRDLLAANEWNGEIPAGVPAGTRVEHKNGWNNQVRHDGGIVRPPDAAPFVLVVCTTSTIPDPDAQQLIADIAAVAWQGRHNLDAAR